MIGGEKKGAKCAVLWSAAAHTVTRAKLSLVLFLHEGETREEGKRRLGNDTQERATCRKEVLRKKLEKRKCAMSVVRRKSLL